MIMKLCIMHIVRKEYVEKCWETYQGGNMKKKISLLLVMIMTLTMLFGSSMSVWAGSAKIVASFDIFVIPSI